MSIPQTDHQGLLASTPACRAWLLLGAIAFALATADLIFACSYWCALYHLPPSRLVQNIASGLLGKAAFAGGAHTVVLGLLLQYAMLSMMVGAYYLLSRRFAGLRRHPWRYGPLYGVILFIVMNDIVVPLSAAPKAPFVMSWILASIAVHVLIGLASAHGARLALRS
jgi:hypothetical protein